MLAQASRRVRLSSFPPYLMVQLRRYYVDTDWTPKKLEAFVEVPERLSLQALRGRGAQPGEELQPEVPREAAAAAAQPVPDEAIVAQLVSMGFAQNGSKRAAIATGNTSECSRSYPCAQCMPSCSSHSCFVNPQCRRRGGDGVGARPHGGRRL